MPKTITLILAIALSLAGTAQIDQDRCEKAVVQFLESKLPGNSFKHVRFTPVQSDIPKEITALHELQDAAIKITTAEGISDSLRTALLFENDSISELLQAYIDYNNLQATYTLTDIFKMKDTSGTITIIEGAFTLSEAFEVLDVRQKMNTTLVLDEEKWLEHFLAEEPIYLYRDSDKQRKANDDLYDYFYNELSKENDQKGDLLHAVLLVIKHIRTNRDFNLNTMLEEAVYLHLYRSFEGIYYPGEFSDHTTSDAGYQVTHSYTLGVTDLVHDSYTQTFTLDKFYVVQQD